MKRLVIVAALVLGTCASLPAQQAGSLSFSPAQPASTLRTSASGSNLFPELMTPSAALSNPAVPRPALPDAPRAPQGNRFGDQDYRWDLAIGYEYVHFESAPFTSNMSGLHTDLTYKLNNWFGLEGSLVSAFGGDVFSGERSKYVLFTGGGRIFSYSSERRWEPWAHALVGGAHLNPQIANSSKNGFALQLGGGADWRYTSRVSIRAEADYVRTQLYSSSQNNFQIGVGAVLHF
jgi:opacity protein-like surface antigen